MTKSKHQPSSTLLITIILASLAVTSSTTATVSSSSAIVGVTSDYTITVTNQTNITRVEFGFSQWTTINPNPFSGTSKLNFSGLTFSPIIFPLTLFFILGTTVSGPSYTFVITNMRNPSSTQPYPLTVIITDSSGTATSYSTSLTLSTISNSSFSQLNYINTIGTTSNTVIFYLSPVYARQMASTFLQITYDSTLISISLGINTALTVVSSTTGTILINGYGTVSSTLITIQNVTMVNPLAGVTFTINCRFYLLSGGIQYNIQNFYNTQTLTPIAYTSLTTNSTFQSGVQTSLSITSSCVYSQVSGSDPANPAYTILSYTSTQLQPSGTSNCASTSTTTCQHTLASPYSLTSILPSIGTSSLTSLTFTSYTFHQTAYYPLCQSTLTVSITSQTLAPTVDLTSCSDIISQQNSLSLVFDVSSVSSGDVVYISGIQGILTGWTQTIISGTSWYHYTLATSNIVGKTTSISTVTIPLTFSNPSYTTTNSISSLNLQRSSTIYARYTTTLPLCTTSIASTITAYSLLSSNLLTYQPNNIQLDLTSQIYDYIAGDYLIINFGSSNGGNVYVLQGELIGITYGFTINGVAVTSSVVNSTAVRLDLNARTLPTVSSPIIIIVCNNLVNPPMGGSLWLQITTHSLSTGGIKQALTTTILTITPNTLTTSSASYNLLSNNTITLTLSNPNRNLLSQNSSSTTTLTLTLPTNITCSTVINNTLSITWFGALSSTGTLYSGNKTNLVISLGSCYVDYLSTTPSIVISQLFNSLVSTSTSLSVSNICGSDCYQCSSGVCTSCFNSNYTTLINLYNGACFSICPDGSYQQSVNLCASCHSTCLICNGPTYTDCTTCATNYQFSTSGYCLSICGIGKYLAGGSCLSCHSNCEACTSSTNCYVCKTNATLINTQCTFTTCFGQCLTCMGTQSICTSCVDTFSLYQSTCVSQCPSGTYSTNENGLAICKAISQPNAYIPCTITGLLGILIIFALRAYSSKKMGNQSRRTKAYSPQNQLNYKINIIRVSAVLFTYLEIIAAIVIAAKNSSYGLQIASTPVIAIGLVFHLIANVTFIVGYCVIVHKHRVVNQSQQEEQNKSSIKHKIVMALSVCLSFRSYKLLYSNLFVQRTPEGRSLEKTAYPNQEQLNPMSKITVNSGGLTDILPMQSMKMSSNNKKSKQFKNMSMKKSSILKTKNKQNIPQKPVQSINSKKPIKFNSFQDSIKQSNLKNSNSNLIINDKQASNFRKLNHPFLTYLTMASLLTASLLLLVAASLQILNSSFSNMLFWGVDALIVIIVSFCLTAWDLWSFTNLKRQEQNSQMTSQNAEVNHTHQNLKQAAQMEIQIQVQSSPIKSGSGNASPKMSKSFPKRVNSFVRPPKVIRKSNEKVSTMFEEQMSGGRSPGIKPSKSKQSNALKINSTRRSPPSRPQLKQKIQKQVIQIQQKSENPPMLKIFDDFDQKDQIFRQTKSKKFSTKNLKFGRKPNSSKHNISLANAKKSMQGELVHDIFVHFNRNEVDYDRDNSTTYNQRSLRSGSRSRGSASPNRSLEEVINLDYDELEQPPNFQDISDIQDAPVEVINFSQSDVPDLSKNINQPQKEQ